MVGEDLVGEECAEDCAAGGAACADAERERGAVGGGKDVAQAGGLLEEDCGEAGDGAEVHGGRDLKLEALVVVALGEEEAVAADEGREDGGGDGEFGVGVGLAEDDVADGGGVEEDDAGAA